MKYMKNRTITIPLVSVTIVNKTQEKAGFTRARRLLQKWSNIDTEFHKVPMVLQSGQMTYDAYHKQDGASTTRLQRQACALRQT